MLLENRVLPGLLMMLVCGLAFGADEVRPWKGDFGFSYSDNRTSYVSRKFLLEADVTHKLDHNETVSECLVDRRYVMIPGAAAQVSSYRYDGNVKWKHYYDDTLFYSYLSPRVRHNNTGYFTGAQALRIGSGRKVLLDNDLFEMNIELGIGYRFATLGDQSRIREGLFTLSDKFAWNITTDLLLKFNLVHEQSIREKYRTTTIELINRFTRNLGIKFQIAQKHTYPFDSNERSGELFSSIGLDYTI